VKEDLKISRNISVGLNPTLLKIIYSWSCNLSGVLDFLLYTERNFGKTAVVAKDTPAFIGNRVGILVFKVYSIWLKRWA
jgi:hypothetical protein